MLPAEHRLRSGRLFGVVVRKGRRAGRGTVTLHLLLDAADPGPARAGLVVGKAVGGSVVRHAVSRRLRHQLQPLVPVLPLGALLVVRAAPSAATASSADLGRDLRSGLASLGLRP